MRGGALTHEGRCPDMSALACGARGLSNPQCPCCSHVAVSNGGRCSYACNDPNADLSFQCGHVRSLWAVSLHPLHRAWCLSFSCRLVGGQCACVRLFLHVGTAATRRAQISWKDKTAACWCHWPARLGEWVCQTMLEQLLVTWLIISPCRLGRQNSLRASALVFLSSYGHAEEWHYIMMACVLLRLAGLIGADARAYGWCLKEMGMWCSLRIGSHVTSCSVVHKCPLMQALHPVGALLGLEVGSHANTLNALRVQTPTPPASTRHQHARHQHARAWLDGLLTDKTRPAHLGCPSISQLSPSCSMSSFMLLSLLLGQHRKLPQPSTAGSHVRGPARQEGALCAHVTRLLLLLSRIYQHNLRIPLIFIHHHVSPFTARWAKQRVGKGAVLGWSVKESSRSS